MNYNLFDRCLYKLAFNTKKIQHLFSEYESDIFKSQIEKQKVEGMVFICGLPRSGTTILLESLTSSGLFVTHKYSHLPFIFTPIFWSYLSKKIKLRSNKMERMHGDGIYINHDSPEAFEEMLWESFNSIEYKEKWLRTWDTKEIPHFNLFFKEHIRKLMVVEGGSKSVYLSKNNGNILRVNYIRNNFPLAKVLILYREPLQHCYSLLKQHKMFLESHSKNSFYSTYMEGIAHFDFGQNFKPINFNNWLINNPYQPTELNFWLLYWLNTYSFLLEHFRDDCYFSSFENINREPEIALHKIKKYLSLNQLKIDSTLFESQKEHVVNDGFCHNLYSRCSVLYSEINSLSLK